MQDMPPNGSKIRDTSGKEFFIVPNPPVISRQPFITGRMEFSLESDNSAYGIKFKRLKNIMYPPKAVMLFSAAIMESSMW